MSGRRTASATDNSTREMYHDCLGHAGSSNRTGRDVAQILPRTAASSGVGGKAYNTPEKSHVWDRASIPMALTSEKGDR